jgi:hypothetical protein
MARTTLIFLATVVLTLTAAWAQDLFRDRYRLAETFERAGDLRGAARLYQELHQLKPESVEAFNGVVRTLTLLQQEKSLRPLVEARLIVYPDDELHVLAGWLAWKTNDTLQANNHWAKASTSTQPHVLYQLAESYANASLQERAIGAFKRYRTVQGLPYSASDELARLYAARGQRLLAIEETLLSYQEHADVQRIKGMLLAYATAEEYPKLEAMIERSSIETFAKLRLLQWLFVQQQQWDKALSVSQELDEQSGSNGYEVLLFADAQRSAGNYAVALKAYSSLMRSPSQQARANATFGYTRTIEQQYSTNTSMTANQAKELIQQYQTIVDNSPTSPVSAEALLRIGLLHLTPLGDQSTSNEKFKTLIKQFPSTVEAARATILLADAYVLTNPGEAHKLYSTLATSNNVRFIELRDAAKIRIADLLWQQRNQDSAIALYKTVVANTESSHANDARDRLVLYQMLADEDSLVARTSVEAFGLQHTKQWSKAAMVLQHNARKVRDEDVRDQLLVFAAENWLAANNDSSGVEVLAPVVARVPESVYGDKALFLLASAVSTTQPEKAKELLTILLANYPRSIFVPRSRERIRQLRGDS